MNLTRKQKKMLTKFFKKELVPLKNDIDNINREKNKKRDSFFIVRDQKTLNEKNIKLCINREEEIIDALELMWDNTRLKPLAKKIVSLSPLFKEIQQSDSVSPFVYEMF